MYSSENRCDNNMKKERVLRRAFALSLNRGWCVVKKTKHNKC